MKLIKQTLFKVEVSKPKTQWHEVFFVEADTMEEALALAKEVIDKDIAYTNEWQIQSINSYSPLYRTTTKTITVEL